MIIEIFKSSYFHYERKISWHGYYQVISVWYCVGLYLNLMYFVLVVGLL